MYDIVCTCTYVCRFVGHTARVTKCQRKWEQVTGKTLSFEDLPSESLKTESKTSNQGGQDLLAQTCQETVHTEKIIQTVKKQCL